MARLPDDARGVLVPVDWLADYPAPVNVPLDRGELRLELGPIVKGVHYDVTPLAALRVKPVMTHDEPANRVVGGIDSGHGLRLAA